MRYRLELFIQGKAPDGMDINRYYNFDWTDPAPAPDDKAVLAQCAVLQKELEALVKAPLVEPFAGPAMLTGRAAAVFFHEVFGHRDEGFRQKDINEGQTFARKVGEQILPNFISIVDDPTAAKLGTDGAAGLLPVRRRRHRGAEGDAGGSRACCAISRCRASRCSASCNRTGTDAGRWACRRCRARET